MSIGNKYERRKSRSSKQNASRISELSKMLLVDGKLDYFNREELQRELDLLRGNLSKLPEKDLEFPSKPSTANNKIQKTG